MSLKIQKKNNPAALRRIVILSAMLALTASCQTGSLQATMAPPKGYTPSTSKALSSEAENYRGRFSPDGQNVIFISRKRSKHRHSEIYEVNVSTQKERRVTFQDGEIFDVAYDPAGQRVYYSSTTDEIKERPEFIRKAVTRSGPADAEALVEAGTNLQFGERLPATEIYSSTRDGRAISRLTDSEGFDGFASVSKSGDVVFVSARGKKHRLFAMNISSKNVTSVSGPHGDDTTPSLSPSGKELLWVRGGDIWLGDSKAGKGKAILTSGSDTKPAEVQHLEPHWLTNGEEFVFTSNRDEKDNFEIYVAKKDGSCIRRLTFDKALDRSPDVSPDGKKFIFTSLRETGLHLYVADFNPPPCPASTPSVQ